MTVLGRKSGVSDEKPASSRFSDVKVEDFFSPYTEWAAKCGIVSGTGNGRFSPNGRITREQMAAILYRYAKFIGAGDIQNGTEILKFPDTGDVADYAKEAMTWAVDKEILNGSNGRLNPKGTATRAQVAQVFLNAKDVLTKTESSDAPVVTPDVPAPTPAPTPNSITCAFDESTGTLTIGGSGDMDFDYNTPPPWLENSRKIKSVIIENGITSISVLAFIGCDGLTDITIPESVTNIEDCAFSSCGSLKNINVASKNQKYQSIDGVLFDTASRKLSAYPSGREDKEYEIPEGITGISSDAFYKCSLTSIIIPDSVTSIGSNAFVGDTKLVYIKLSDNITYIGDSAFSYCGLLGIAIPDDVTVIGSRAFANCFGLKEIVIPASVTEIQEAAFRDCMSLTTVKYCGSETQWKEISIGANNDCLNHAEKIYV